MDLKTRAAIVLLLLGLVAAATLALRARRRDRFEPALPVLSPRDVGELKAPLTAVYFTSRFCSSCKDTPQVIRDAAPEVPQRAIDVRDRPDLARKLALVETPTLLLVDARGRIRYAHVGNPTPEELWTYAREAWDSLEMEGEISRNV